MCNPKNLNKADMIFYLTSLYIETFLKEISITDFNSTHRVMLHRWRYDGNRKTNFRVRPPGNTKLRWNPLIIVGNEIYRYRDKCKAEAFICPILN